MPFLLPNQKHQSAEGNLLTKFGINDIDGCLFRACVERSPVTSWLREGVDYVHANTAETAQDCDVRGTTAEPSEAEGRLLQPAKY